MAKSSLAADYYVAQNQAGSGNASSCANAKAITWNWTNPNVTGNDTVWVCGNIIGGVGAAGITIGASGSLGHPITLKFCSGASDCGAGTAVTMEAPYWDKAISCSGKQHVVIDGNGGIIKNTDNGDERTYQSGSTGVYSTCSDLEVKNLTINDLYVAVNNYGSNHVLTLNVAPATAWNVGDLITGQTSGLNAYVVRRKTGLIYDIRPDPYVANKDRRFASGEIVGVTGVPEKLADQGLGYPIESSQIRGSAAISSWEVDNQNIHNITVDNAYYLYSYRNVSASTHSNISIYDSTVKNSCWGAYFGIGGAGSILDNTRFSDNDVTFGSNWIDSLTVGERCHVNGFYAFSSTGGTASYFSNFNVYNNKFVGPNNGQYWTGSGFVHMENTASANLWNNLFVGNQYGAPSPYYMSVSRTGSAPGVGEGTYNIFNNTITKVSGSPASWGISTGAASGKATIKNNIIDKTSNALVIGGTNSYEFVVDSDYNDFSNNTTAVYDFRFPDWDKFVDVTARDAYWSAHKSSLVSYGSPTIVGEATYYVWIGATNPSTYNNVNWFSLGQATGYFASTALTAWQTFSGNDAHSISISPDLNADDTPKVTSPVRGTGIATGQLSAADKAGTSWASPPSIGAYEYSSGVTPPPPPSDTTPPASPTGLVVN